MLAQVFKIGAFEKKPNDLRMHKLKEKILSYLKPSKKCFITGAEHKGCGITQVQIQGGEPFGIMGMREQAKLNEWDFNITGAACRGKGNKSYHDNTNGG